MKILCLRLNIKKMPYNLKTTLSVWVEFEKVTKNFSNNPEAVLEYSMEKVRCPKCGKLYMRKDYNEHWHGEKWKFDYGNNLWVREDEWNRRYL